MTQTLSSQLRRLALGCLIAATSTCCCGFNSGYAAQPIIHSLETHDAITDLDALAQLLDEFGSVLEEPVEPSTCNYDAFVASQNAITSAPQVNAITSTPVIADETNPSLEASHPLDLPPGPIIKAITSAPLIADNPPDLPPGPRSQTASTFDKSVAAIAAAACASTGVSVEQIIEPFAMVSPDEISSPEEILELIESWNLTNAEPHSAEELLIENLVAEEDEPISTRASSTDADAVEGDVIDTDDAEFEIVSIVPLVDFDSITGFSGSRPSPLASVAAANPDSESPSSVREPLEQEPQDGKMTELVVAEDQIRAELDSLAAEEPHDTNQRNLHSFGPSVLEFAVDKSTTTENAALPNDVQTDSLEDSVATISEDPSAGLPFSGTSPMIVTIAEGSTPYDLAVRDFQVNSLFPLAKRPFCIRSRVDLPELPSALSSDDAELWGVEAVLPDSGMADCLLDDSAWQWELAASAGSKLQEWLQTDIVRNGVTEFVVDRDRFASGVAGRLAQIWPASAPLPLPSPEGAELLVRAGIALPASADVGISDEELAEATETLKQLFVSAKQIASSFQASWERIAKVPTFAEDLLKSTRR